MVYRAAKPHMTGFTKQIVALAIFPAIGMFSTSAIAQIAAPNDPKLAPMVELTMVVNGPGEIRGAGTPCKTTLAQPSVVCKRMVIKDKPITLEAIAPAGAMMTGWTGSCSGGAGQRRCLLQPSANLGVTASFAKAPAASMATVTVVIPVGGGMVKPAPFVSLPITCSRPVDGTVEGTCTGTVPVGTKIELFATAFPHAKFMGWQSGNPGCQKEKCLFDVTGSTSLTAQFAAPRFQRQIISKTGYQHNVKLTTSTPGATLVCGPKVAGYGVSTLCTLRAFADGPAAIDATGPVGTTINGQAYFKAGCKEIIASRCIVMPGNAPIIVP